MVQNKHRKPKRSRDGSVKSATACRKPKNADEAPWWRIYCKALSEFGSKNKAAEAVNINRSGVARAQKEYPVFDQMVKDAIAVFMDTIEDRAHELTLLPVTDRTETFDVTMPDGSVKRVQELTRGLNYTHLARMLIAHNPDKYQPRQKMEIRGEAKVGVILKNSVTDEWYGDEPETSK